MVGHTSLSLHCINCHVRTSVLSLSRLVENGTGDDVRPIFLGELEKMLEICRRRSEQLPRPLASADLLIIEGQEITEIAGLSHQQILFNNASSAGSICEAFPPSPPEKSSSRSSALAVSSVTVKSASRQNCAIVCIDDVRR